MCNALLLTLSLTDGDGCIRGRVGKEKDKSYSIGQKKKKQTNTVLQLWPISLPLLRVECGGSPVHIPYFSSVWKGDGEGKGVSKTCRMVSYPLTQK